jgi:predicted alpha/beta superfamily hydrolase
MRRPGLLLAAAAALALAACAQAPQAPRAHTALPNVHVLADPFVIPRLNRTRTLRVYLPPSYDASPGRRYPVVYMHDGQNLFDDATSYVGEWGVDETLNALAASHGFEAIVVGIDHGGDKRMNELNPWPTPQFGAGEGEAYLDFVVGVVKPYVDAHYRSLTDARSTAVIGSSMGGLISDVAIHRHPQVFGKAGVFSPAYWTADHGLWDYDVKHPLAPGARVYLYAGGQEGPGMVELTERMDRQLEGALPEGAAVTMHIAPTAQHNEAAWRRELATALIWLFELQPRSASN